MQGPTRSMIDGHHRVRAPQVRDGCPVVAHAARRSRARRGRRVLASAHVTQTEPSPTATADGMRADARRCRSTFRSSGIDPLQRRRRWRWRPRPSPSPTARPPGAPPSWIGSPATRFVAGSMRDERLVADVRDPHAALPDGDVRRPVADPDRRDDAVAVRVDARDRAAAEVGDPHRALAERDALGRRADLDRPADPCWCWGRCGARCPRPSRPPTRRPRRRRCRSARCPGRSSSASRPVRASTRATREPRPAVTHTEPSPSATYSGASPTWTGRPSTFFESGSTATSVPPSLLATQTLPVADGHAGGAGADLDRVGLLQAAVAAAARPARSRPRRRDHGEQRQEPDARETSALRRG